MSNQLISSSVIALNGLCVGLLLSKSFSKKRRFLSILCTLSASLTLLASLGLNVSYLNWLDALVSSLLLLFVYLKQIQFMLPFMKLNRWHALYRTSYVMLMITLSILWAIYSLGQWKMLSNNEDETFLSWTVLYAAVEWICFAGTAWILLQVKANQLALSQVWPWLTVKFLLLTSRLWSLVYLSDYQSFTEAKLIMAQVLVALDPCLLLYWIETSEKILLFTKSNEILRDSALEYFRQPPVLTRRLWHSFNHPGQNAPTNRTDSSHQETAPNSPLPKTEDTQYASIPTKSPVMIFHRRNSSMVHDSEPDCSDDEKVPKRQASESAISSKTLKLPTIQVRHISDNNLPIV